MLYPIIYPILLIFFRITTWVLGRVRAVGRENVPAKGGVLYCANHVSDSDPVFLLVTIPRRAWFIGKQELFDVPFQRWLFTNMQGFPIKRDSPDRAALRRAEEILKSGEPLVLFPEGRLAREGNMQRLQPGAAMLSLRAGVPIVPIGLTNTNKVMPYGYLIPQFSRDPVTVRFGKPISPQEFDSLPKGERLNAITKRLAEEIAALSGQSVPESEILKSGTDV